MWLLTTFLAAVLATVLAFIFKSKYKLNFLALMLWGATIMILTDHILGYEGGPFLESKTEGIIGNSTILGLLMLLPVIAAWLSAVLVSKFRKSKINFDIPS